MKISRRRLRQIILEQVAQEMQQDTPDDMSSLISQIDNTADFPVEEPSEERELFNPSASENADPNIVAEFKKIVDLADALYTAVIGYGDIANQYNRELHAVWVQDLRTVIRDRHYRVTQGVHGKPSGRMGMSLGRTFGKVLNKTKKYVGEMFKLLYFGAGIPGLGGRLKESTDVGSGDLNPPKDRLIRRLENMWQAKLKPNIKSEKGRHHETVIGSTWKSMIRNIKAAQTPHDVIDILVEFELGHFQKPEVKVPSKRPLTTGPWQREQKHLWNKTIGSWLDTDNRPRNWHEDVAKRDFVDGQYLDLDYKRYARWVSSFFDMWNNAVLEFYENPITAKIFGQEAKEAEREIQTVRDILDDMLMIIRGPILQTKDNPVYVRDIEELIQNIRVTLAMEDESAFMRIDENKLIGEKMSKKRYHLREAGIIQERIVYDEEGNVVSNVMPGGRPYTGPDGKPVGGKVVDPGGSLRKTITFEGKLIVDPPVPFDGSVSTSIQVRGYFNGFGGRQAHYMIKLPEDIINKWKMSPKPKTLGTYHVYGRGKVILKPGDASGAFGHPMREDTFYIEPDSFEIYFVSGPRDERKPLVKPGPDVPKIEFGDLMSDNFGPGSQAHSAGSMMESWNRLAFGRNKG